MQIALDIKGQKEIDEMFKGLSEKNINKIIKSSSRKAINLVTKKAKANLKSSYVHTSQSMLRGIRTTTAKKDVGQGYVGAVSKAARTKKPKKAEKTYKNKSNLLHIFEDGTIERYWKTHSKLRKSKNKKLRKLGKMLAKDDKKHRTGKVGGVNFFKGAVTSEQTKVLNTFNKEVIDKINKLTNNSIE